MAWYKTGTISVTTGQTSVTGVGTKFASNARVGDGFRGPDGEWYEIVNIASETVLGIFPAYVGATVSGSVNWMIAPLQGYNKESADRLRAITDNISATIDSINNKQDKNAKLTAISNTGTVASQSLPVYTSDTNVSFSPISNAGLNLVSKGTTPELQSTLGLIPIQHPNDITPGRLITPGWMGLGTVSSNRLPSDNAQIAQPAGLYYTTATWAGSPYSGTDGRNQGYLTVHAWSSASYMAQTWEPLRRSDAPMMHRYAYNGVWQEWQIILSGVRLQSSVNMDQRLIMRDVIGIGTPHTYCLSIDAKTLEEGLILGYSYVNSTTVGTKPGGYVFGVVNTIANQSDHLQQDFVGLNGVPGTTQRAYRRSGYGGGAGAWGPWRLVIDSASAQDDVETLGGVVSRTIIQGCVVNKFASGLIIINGSLGASQSIAAGAVSEVNLTLPASTGPDVNFSTASCIASPYVTNDWYGITNAYMSSPTNLKLILRNGATAQQFGIRGIIIGHWK